MARVQPSATGAVLERATALREAGRDVISLGAGEPDFDTPRSICNAAIEAIADGATRYTPVGGSSALKRAICDKLRRDNALGYQPSQILVTSGAKQALYNLAMALLGPGDEVIVPAPYWVSYPQIARLAEAEPVIIDAGIEQDFKITPVQLEQALTPATRLFILNSPCNPTGSAYSRDELAALGAVLESRPDIAIASDDIYEHIYWGDEPFASFATACPALFDRTVTINGVSKAYAMTGWRIGYAAGPEPLITAMQTIQSQCTSNACSISQRAALAALEGNQAPVREMVAAYRRRHDMVVERLHAMPGIECRPGEGTFYAFPRVSGLLSDLGLADDVALAELLLDQAGVAIVPGSAFGAPGYIRVSFAADRDTLDEALQRIERAVVA